MSGVLMTLLSSGTAIGPVIESHTLTTGAAGTAGARLRGFSSGTPIYGTLSPTATTISGATQIITITYDESGPSYLLTLNGGTNSGWTFMTVDGTTNFSRASATYTGSPVFTWQWNTTDSLAAQVFSGAGTTHTVTFS